MNETKWIPEKKIYPPGYKPATPPASARPTPTSPAIKPWRDEWKDDKSTGKKYHIINDTSFSNDGKVAGYVSKGFHPWTNNIAPTHPKSAAATPSVPASPPPPAAGKPIAPKAKSLPANAEPKDHYISCGETLSGISVKYYGSAKYVALIAKANGIKDPDLIIAGNYLKIPAL